MLKSHKKILFFILVIFFYSACSSKSYHNEMIENTKKSFDKRDYSNIKKSYSRELVDERLKQKTYINVLEDKTLSDVLKEMELLDDNFYFLKSSDIVIPKSRIKIHNMDELNSYLKAILDKELFIKKSGSIYLVKLLSVSESKKKSIQHIPFRLNGQISVEELIKLIIKESGYEVSIGNYIKNKDEFQDSIININSNNLIDALNSLGHTKNVFVNIDYEKEIINLNRYKDIVIELNIPLLDIKTSNETQAQEISGQSKIKNSSQIQLYTELDKMLKNIISTDRVSTYHIDKASGLIFLKSTKAVEKAVRQIVKAYELAFSKEATIEFERIEIALNKSRAYGITTASSTPTAPQTTSSGTANTLVQGVTRKIEGEGALTFTSQNLHRLLSLTGKAENKIGRVLNYTKNVIVLKNNIPTVQSMSQNTDYISKIETTVNDTATSTESTVSTIKDGTSITAMAKVLRDRIFLNITPTIKKLIKITEAKVGTSTIQLPQYNDQSYNISREVRLGEKAIVGSIIVHDDSKTYQGILPLEYFAIGGTDGKSYVRREIVFVVTVNSIKGF